MVRKRPHPVTHCCDSRLKNKVLSTQALGNNPAEFDLVYAEEDVFEDAGDNSKIVVRTPSKRSLSASPASPASPLRRA